MTESSEHAKSTEKRLQESKKWEAETARSLAVARAKQAHEMIEATEKRRKRSTMFSICDRLYTHAILIRRFLLSLLNTKSKHLDYEMTSAEKAYIEDVMRTYKSIRYDFQKNNEIKDEEMEKLFPMLNADFSEFMVTCSKLSSVVDQMLDMVAYCKRTWW